MERISKFLSEHPDIFELDVRKTPDEKITIIMCSKNSSAYASRLLSSQEVAEASDDDAFIFRIFEQLYSMIKKEEAAHK